MQIPGEAIDASGILANKGIFYIFGGLVYGPLDFGPGSLACYIHLFHLTIGKDAKLALLHWPIQGLFTYQ